MEGGLKRQQWQIHFSHCPERYVDADLSTRAAMLTEERERIQGGTNTCLCVDMKSCVYIICTLSVLKRFMVQEKKDKQKGN